MILVKIPTRERGFAWLQPYLNLSTHPGTRFLISVDDNDPQPLTDPLLSDSRVKLVVGKSANKIEAINRDIAEYGGDWQMLIVGSDDMRPTLKGYDTLLLKELQAKQPEGCLWLPTEDSTPHMRNGKRMIPGSPAYLQYWICMLPVMSRPYYDRFGYVYHPAYQNFWCDNEYTDVARSLGAISYCDISAFKHLHPSWDATGKADEVYLRANRTWQADMKTYRQRQRFGFK